MTAIDERGEEASINPWVLRCATGFGLGLSPFASGTVGSLLGVLIVLAIYPFVGIPGQIVVAFLLTVLAFPICGAAESHFEKKDDGRIVADEYLTFPICMIGLPLSLEYWWILPMAFLTNRVCDIVKPPPAYQLQRLKGGWGVVMDDVAASFYSLLINHALYIYAGRLFGLS